MGIVDSQVLNTGERAITGQAAMTALRGRNAQNQSDGVAVPERWTARRGNCLAFRIAVTDGLQEGHALPLLFLAELVDVAFLPVPLPVFRLG